MQEKVRECMACPPGCDSCPQSEGVCGECKKNWFLTNGELIRDVKICLMITPYQFSSIFVVGLVFPFPVFKNVSLNSL
jgi:hypothetical protein